MKVGILTFHRAHNYGAVLQCYALQEVLKGMGHDVEVIDYRQIGIERKYDIHFRLFGFFKSIVRLRPKCFIMNYIRKKNKSKKFESFRHEYLNESKVVIGNNIPKKYDRFIIGSDQLWNDGITHGFDKVYWGLFDKSSQSKTYGYAISGNGKFKGYIAKESIINGVNAFDGITFREKTLQDVIKSITGKEYPLAIDPTLLTDASTWDPMINKEWSKRHYVVVYEVRPFKEDKDMIVKKAKEYASERNAEVVNLMDDLLVSDFVSAIKYADCIFTSSFHAVAFSVIFRKSFYAFQLYDGNDYRYVDLLKSLNLQDHLADKDTIIEKQNPISNEDLSNRMALLQRDSMTYLELATVN